MQDDDSLEYIKKMKFLQMSILSETGKVCAECLTVLDVNYGQLIDHKL